MGTRRACLAACPAGTFASGTGEGACTPCPAGFFAVSPGAAACQPCAACDDADPCTTDTCSATGCLHEPSCTSVDAGAEAGTGGLGGALVMLVGLIQALRRRRSLPPTR
jgi:hypothetical protein